MIRFFKTIVLLPIFAVLVDFAVSNREFVSLGLWPLSYKVETPIYLLIVTIFILTTIICGLTSFFSSQKIKKEMKLANKELAKSREEVALMKERIEKLKQKAIF